MGKEILKEKSLAFAKRIVMNYKYLTENKKEFVLSKQCLRSGTSIGANIKEAEYAHTKADFIYTLNIALKEASETEYWLILLHESNYLEKNIYDSLLADCIEIIKLLISSIKTAKANLKATKN
jgi:four helix bundle protein